VHWCAQVSRRSRSRVARSRSATRPLRSYRPAQRRSERLVLARQIRCGGARISMPRPASADCGPDYSLPVVQAPSRRLAIFASVWAESRCGNDRRATRSRGRREWGVRLAGCGLSAKDSRTPVERSVREEADQRPVLGCHVLGSFGLPCHVGAAHDMSWRCRERPSIIPGRGMAQATASAGRMTKLRFMRPSAFFGDGAAFSLSLSSGHRWPSRASRPRTDPDRRRQFFRKWHTVPSARRPARRSFGGLSWILMNELCAARAQRHRAAREH